MVVRNTVIRHCHSLKLMPAWSTSDAFLDFFFLVIQAGPSTAFPLITVKSCNQNLIDYDGVLVLNLLEKGLCYHTHMDLKGGKLFDSYSTYNLTILTAYSDRSPSQCRVHKC